MAIRIKPRKVYFNILAVKISRAASDKLILEIKPNLADILWSIIVAKTDTSKAQSKSYPKVAPARVQTVTVPGPMKAAAIKGPGPISLRNLNIEPKRVHDFFA